MKLVNDINDNKVWRKGDIKEEREWGGGREREMGRWKNF